MKALSDYTLGKFLPKFENEAAVENLAKTIERGMEIATTYPPYVPEEPCQTCATLKKRYFGEKE